LLDALPFSLPASWAGACSVRRVVIWIIGLRRVAGLARSCNHAHFKGVGGGEPLRRSRHYRETSSTTPIIPIGGRMQIVETQELVPSCHRPEIVETSELQPTCHS